MIRVDDFVRALSLTTLCASSKNEWPIESADLNRPGLQFAGHYEYFAMERPQVIGKAEMGYLESLEPEVRVARLRKFFSYPIPCVILCRGMRPPEELVPLAKEHDVPVFQTDVVTTRFFMNAIIYMRQCLAPRETLHGVPVRFAPCVAGYVGGDITAGLLAAGLAELPGEHLFLDIGTNGEMALGGRGGFVCCAVASGPAFEGAGITCGMPGVDGAVSRVRYDRGFLYDVIGGGEPKGLCGSGLLDLTAVLLRLGVIAPGGRLLPPEDAPESLRRCLTRDGDGNGRFHLTPEVYLTAADVRNLQLAKAAVAAGIRVLLQQRGITPEQVDGVYLAGGFGSYLDPESAMAIGMLPRACAGRLHTLGNTALAGAAALALAPAQWQRIGDISRACSYLELSGRADFAAAFTGNLSFPQP